MRIPASLVRSLVVGSTLTLASCDGGSPQAPDPVQSDLDRVALATERYMNVATALADGFIQASPCEAVSGVGAMGHHYLNPARMDGRIVLTEPEVLLYIPEGGQLRLAGVEYILPIVQNGQPYFGTAMPATGAAPTIMGQTFQGPMPGHNPAMPWHFDLHVWLFDDNPAGRFAQFNPRLRCP